MRTLDKFKKEAPPSVALLVLFLFFVLHLLEFVSMLVHVRNVQRE